MNAAPATPDDALQRLHAARPESRHEIIDDLVARHADGKLELSGEAGARPNLRGVRLEGARLRGAAIAFADLHGARLAGVNLSQAELSFAALEAADLRRADLTGADLSGASMGEADLESALLEEANLDQASLRFANMRAAVLEGARVAGADLWGAMLDDAVLCDAGMRGAQMGEVKARGADFSRADLRETDWTDAVLDGASFAGADLRGATLKGARLADVDFSGAQLRDLDLTTCVLTQARWDGAILGNTRLASEQLGAMVGEEIQKQFGPAARSYLALERNFAALGDSEAASWAYRRRRRMLKQAARVRFSSALSAGKIGGAIPNLAVYLGDQLVEGICDYGESLGRVFGAFVLIYVGFTLLYGLTGAVVRITVTPSGSTTTVTRGILDLAAFSLLAMTTSGASSSAASTLVAANLYVELLTGLQALLGIFLTGLMGFVAGHRIRR